MIKSIRLQNFFSFEDETIELHPNANVFVGINGSGKSNVLKAFRLLQEGMARRLRQLILDQWGGIDAIRFKSASDEKPISLNFCLEIITPFSERREIEYSIQLKKVRESSNYSIKESIIEPRTENGESIEWMNRLQRGTAFAKIGEHVTAVQIRSLDDTELLLPEISAREDLFLPNIVLLLLKDLSVYEYFETGPSSQIRRPVIATSERRLMNNGSNLAQMINTLKINSKANYRKLIERLQYANDRYQGIDFNVIGGNIELMLEEVGFNNSTHVTHVSDGTLRYLCQMAIYYNENRGNLICIDEPELGLHPDMIKSIRDALLESSESTQYIISTHSDHLLDLFELEHIRVVEKDENNASRVKSLDPKQFEGWYETFSPGRMWTMGDFGGNRY